MNECSYNPEFNPITCSHLLNQWIVQKVIALAAEVKHHLEDYRFDWAAQSLYQFLWGNFCDVYIECLKPLLGNNDNQTLRDETRQTASWVLIEFLKIAHPFIPLVTEELWHAFYPQAPFLLIQSQWPSENQRSESSSQEVDFILSVISEVRSLRGLFNLSPTLKLPLLISSNSGEVDVLQEHQDWVLHLARLESIEVKEDPEEKIQYIPFVIGQNTFFLKIGHLINLDSAFKILEKKLETLKSEMQHLQKKLTNDAYRHAKPDVWENDQMLFQTKQHEQGRLITILRLS
jgi:valyl-tRNA synthetase